MFMVYEAQLLKSLWWKSDTLEMAAEVWASVYYYYYFLNTAESWSSN